MNFHFYPYSNESATNSRMNFHVRDDIGDDSNPGTVSLPLKTIIEAESRIPTAVNHPVDIQIDSPHGGAGYEWPKFRRRIGHARIYVRCELFVEQLGSTAALSGSGQLVVKSSGFTVGQYDGMTIEILSGAAIGDRRTIRDNTATDITPDLDFSEAVAPGDTYKILRPVVQVVKPDSPVFEAAVEGYGEPEGGIQALDYVPQGSPAIYLINVQVVGYSYLYIRESRVVMLGVELVGAVVDFHGSSLLCGMDSTPAPNWEVGVQGPVDDLGVAHSYQWAGWGITCIDYAHVTGGVFRGFMVMLDYLWGVCDETIAYLYGGHLRKGIFLCWDSTARLILYRQPFRPSGVPRLLIGNYDDGTYVYPCVQCEGGVVELIYVTLYGTSDGLVAASRGIVLCTFESGSVTGIGALTRNGGQIGWDHAVGISGSAGDLSCDNGATTHPKATLDPPNIALVDPTHGRLFRTDNS